MKPLYQYSQHRSFKEASAEAKEVSACHSLTAIVRRSEISEDCWVVLVPQPAEQLKSEFEARVAKAFEEQFEKENAKQDDAAIRDSEHEEQLWREEQEWIAELERRELLSDLESDRDDWARLDETGWFYDE